MQSRGAHCNAVKFGDAHSRGYAARVETRTSLWAIAALGAALQRFDEVRANHLGLVRSLKADGLDEHAKALRASMQLSYAADDLAAVAVQVLQAVTELADRARLDAQAAADARASAVRLLPLAVAVSALSGGLGGALVAWLLLRP